jgi:uncharacterized lipoprotein NlpE involved in copper resistance
MFKTILTALMLITLVGCGNADQPAATSDQPQRQRGERNLPEGFAEMTTEEQQAYFEANGGRPNNRAQQDFDQMFERMEIEKPANWDDMTEEEKQSFMRENRPARNQE